MTTRVLTVLLATTVCAVAHASQRPQDQVIPTQQQRTSEPSQQRPTNVPVTPDQGFTPDQGQVSRDGGQSAGAQTNEQAVIQRQNLELTRALVEYTRDLAEYTLALAVIGGVVGALTIGLLLFQALYTGRTAGAAKRSAEAVMLAERAYVSISHHPPGIDIDDIAVTHAGEEQFGGWHDVTFRFGITNNGNTPARITDISMGHFVGPPADFPPPPTGRATGEHLFLVKGDIASDTRNFQLRHTDVTQLGLTRRLWMLGYVDYIDTFGIRRRAGYGRFFDPNIDQQSFYTDSSGNFDVERFNRRNNLPFVTEPGYNYDREREAGEGNDWDEPTQ